MPTTLRRALLVGVDRYETFNDLGGCEADVQRVRPLLAVHEDGSPNFNCVQRLGTTRERLVKDVRDLLAAGADVALLYFAGHGDPTESDVILCTEDGTSHTPGVAMSEILGLVRASEVPEIILVLDCCFAGAAGGVPQIGGRTDSIRHGVSILAASRGDQTAAETIDGGLFTQHLVAALDGGAADVVGKVTVAGIYAHVTELFGPWAQRPTFKSNVDRLHDLRQCAPALPLDELRRLPEFFATEDFELPLDPSYEPDADPNHPEHEAVFAILQKCRASKLIEPIGHDHMYFAAMLSLPCRLTPLGRHYWVRAKADLL